MIIDTDDYAASGIKATIFPGGEPHVDVSAVEEDRVHIFAKIRTPEDFMKFLALGDALERKGVEAHVFMPYLPGARQDREQPGFAFTANIYAGLMLSQGIDCITAVDVHSEAAVEVYSKYMDVRVLPLGPIVKNAIPRLDGAHAHARRLAVLAPDKGAVDRAQVVARAIGVERVDFCTKKRDPKTGWLVTDQVPDFSQYNSHYDRVLLADDICDGGATFVGIAERLHGSAYNLHLELWVTHGIFSKGFSPLRRFRDIYTTNSFYRGGNQEVFISSGCKSGENETVRVHVIDLLPFYLESLRP